MIEECSKYVVMMCLPRFWYLKHIPLIAVLFDSLAPEVYMISFCFTLSKLLIILVHLSSNSLLFKFG